MFPAIPSIKVTDDADRNSIWRPHSKIRPLAAVHRARMRPQFFVDRIMRPALEHRLVHRIHKIVNRIGITDFYVSLFRLNPKRVLWNLLPS